MAYCGKCGTQLSDGAKFCPKCGASVALETNDDKTPSSKKIVISLVVSIIALICIGGGFYIYQQNKKEEIRKKEELRIKAEEDAKKAEERKRIEEQKKEEERKKAEELATPIGVFYDTAQKKHLWSSKTISHKYWVGNGAQFFYFDLAFFFYPSSKTTGQVSIYQYQDEDGQITFLSDKESRYEIIGNTINILDDFYLKLVNDTRPYKIKLEIERKSEYSAVLRDQNKIGYYNSGAKFVDKYKP